MSTAAQADPAAPAGSASPLAHRRPLGDRIFQILAAAAGVLVLVILALIAISTSQQASMHLWPKASKSSSSWGEPSGNRQRRFRRHASRSCPSVNSRHINDAVGSRAK